MRVIALFLVVAAIFFPEPAQAQGSPNFDIALFGDAGCSTCNVEIPVGESADVYIVGQDFVNGGITGAELRIIGLPAGWAYVLTPNPLFSVALGDPLGSGVNLAFAAVQTGTCILFYRVTIAATSSVENVALSVTRHGTPSNPQFACPRVTIDCGPCIPVLCVPGGDMTINAGPDCTVATLPSTWSMVKSLYAN